MVTGQYDKPQNYPAKKEISPNISLGKLADVLLGKLVREVNRRLASGEDMEAILKFVDGSLAFIIPYDRMAIGTIKDDHLVVSWSNFPGLHGYFSREGVIPINNIHLKEILRTGKPRIVNDLVRFSELNPDLPISKVAAQEGLRSSLTCPLRSKGQYIGMVLFLSYSNDIYNEEHIDTFLDISEQLSAVIVAGWPNVDLYSAQTLRMVLHDLKSPLSVMQSLIDIHSEGGALNKKVSEALLRNTNYMFRILDDLTELDQINNQRDAIKKSKIDLREFIEEVVEDARSMARSKEIHVVVQVDPSLPRTSIFDPIKIRRTLENLISNGVKFSNPGTQIGISAWSADGRINFSVQDHGQGIPVADFSKLFKEFGKTSVLPTAGERSTGLGLLIAKRIVEQHGGNLSFESVVGEGSTFSFWLPQG